MYLRIGDSQRTGGLGWFVDTMIGPTTVSAGHEELTEKAAAGLVADRALVKALIDGARRPDLADPLDHIKAGEERRHFLRAGLRESSRSAWDKAVNHLRGLHRRIVAAPQWTPLQFELIGEALHLIQDSYAPAHVERRPPARVGGDPRKSEIVRVRYYGASLFATAPREHIHRIDPRDNIRLPILKMLRPEAQHAIAAGRAYLNMVLGHIRMSPAPAQVEKELSAFIFDYMRMHMPTLRGGSSGAAVQILQERLNLWLTRAGLPPIAVSGKFDSETRKAVLKFQKALRLGADGVVGPRTWKSLPLP